MENLSGLQESIFNLSRGPQLHFGEKSKNWSNFIKFTDFPLFPLFGVPWAAVIVFSVAEHAPTSNRAIFDLWLNSEEKRSRLCVC